MTDLETPKFSRRRRAVAVSAIATGICILLADAAGLRTTVLEGLSSEGISSPIANLSCFAAGLLCFWALYLFVLTWLTSREVLAETRRRWWLRKRVIGVVMGWVLVASPFMFI